MLTRQGSRAGPTAYPPVVREVAPGKWESPMGVAKPGWRTKKARRRRPRRTTPIKIGPTLEYLAKRLALAAGTRGADAYDRCGYPLGWLLAHKHITREEHDRGIEYARLHYAAVGKPFPKTLAIEKEWPERTERSDEDEERIERRYRRAREALLREGQVVAVAVEAAAVREDMSAVLDKTLRPAIKHGLRVLAQNTTWGR